MEKASTRPSRMQIRANAKVNLVLEVGGLRSDGYHEIASVILPVHFCDSLTIETSQRDELAVPHHPELENQDNLAWRAVEAFRKATGWRQPVSVKIDKQIWIGAGLGGGSSNAAAALRALKEMSGIEIDLWPLAASLGSDVPAMLFDAPVLALGRGEVVQPLANLPVRFALLIAKPKQTTCPTAWAYQVLDRHRPKGSIEGRAEALAQAIQSINASAELAEHLYNDFDEAIMDELQDVAELRDRLYHCGALKVVLTGSGSGQIALFDDELKANRAAESLVDCLTKVARHGN